MDIDLEKRYNLPEYKLVEYDDKTIAVMYNIGRWIVMDNKLQVEILCKIYCHYTVGEIVSEYKDNIDDIISVLVQIEAKQLENGSTVDICDYTSLQLCLTNKCNLRCPHCYMFSGAENENELTIKEICGICKDFRNYGGKEVILTGGEITTRGDLLEIISAISDTGLKISLFSNGVSWSEELIDFLKKVPVKKIQISIATAIDMYLRQISLTGGIPFAVSLPKAPAAINADNMTAAELHAALQAGLDDIEAGNVQDAFSAFTAFRDSHR